jgi:hypothetical protein
VAHRDQLVLENLRATLGVGSLRVLKARNPKHLEQVVFTVNSLRAHQTATVPFFNDFLPVSEKRRQFEIWRDAMIWWDAVRPSRYGKGPSPCSEPGCDRPVRGRGLCRIHYYRETGY